MANTAPEGLVLNSIKPNRWVWLFYVNGIIAIWSMRCFLTREACLVDAANKNLVL